MFIVQISQNQPTLNLSEHVIRQMFPASALEAGRIYELRGRVQNLVIALDGSLITAETQGAAPDPYAQRIKLQHVPNKGLLISGVCTCPVGRLCKHLAAVLIAARRQMLVDARTTARSAPPPQPQTRKSGETLPYLIQHWLSGLQTDIEDESEDYPQAVRNRLLFVLAADDTPHGAPPLAVQPVVAALLKSGTWGSIRPFNPNANRNAVRYLRPSDRLILRDLVSNGIGRYRFVQEQDPAGALRRILGTGRAYWTDTAGPALSLGPARKGAIGWTLDPDGNQHSSVVLDKGLHPVRLPAPWYVDPQAARMGPVSLDIPLPVANRILSAPPIPAAYVPKVRAELARCLPEIAVPAPEELAAPERITDPVRPHLRLINGTLPMDPARGRGSARTLSMGLFEVPLARLSFQYGPVSFQAGATPPPAVLAHQGKLYEPDRDLDGEAQALEQMAMLGFGHVKRLVPVFYAHAHTDDYALIEDDSGTDWIAMVTRDVPRLRAQGWTVDIDANFPLQVITPDSEIEAELEEGSGIDWLELHLGVMVDGERIDLVPALIRLITKGDLAVMLERPDDVPFLLPLPDGRKVALPLHRIRPTLQALLELFAGGGIDPNSGRIGFSRLDAADVAVLEERAGLVWRGGEALRALGRQLRAAGDTIPQARIPEAFRGSLRAYQKAGVDWLQFLRAAGLGGVLADDMGLGKTVQTLAHLMIEKAEGRLTKPALIVCPTSLVPNWVSEAERFAPSLKLLPLHGPARKERFGQIDRHDLVLSTYPLLSRDHDVLTAQEWHAVILDEAQTIKNPNAETTRQALRLKAAQRLCLSGTPLQNHLGELWSIFDFLAPGFLGNQRSFRTCYRTPIEKHGDAARSTLLTRRVRPFLLRRTKEEVVKELPPKTEITERVAMEAGQQAIYEGIRLAMHTRVKAAIEEKGLARSGIIILDALLKLRQACCDPRLLKLKAVSRSKAGSAKLDRLMEMLGIMLSEGRRVLLFSQFTEMLALIERRLADEEIEHLILTGDTKDRGTPVRRFQSGEVPVFLISLKAGGVGLNLTAADTVIHYDPWWNPAAEDQATDRAHRIGQSKKVFVHRLVTLGTIEEKMEVLKEKKRALVASVMEAEHGGALKMTEADVEALFAPGA